MNTQELAAKYGDYIIGIRREFHANPELSNKEFETTRRIKEELDAIGIPYLSPAPTGVIAVIQGGKGPGKTVARRGDIDALPLQEMGDAPYRSKNDGVMHACGHDCHGASLLGAAKVLHELRDSFAGTVKLVFQPAEEYFPSGALAMMAGGDLDDVSAFFGIHVAPALPTGSFCLQAGPRMAASASVDITVKGVGGHGGVPHQSIDATVAAAAIIMNLQTLASRELSVDNPAIITIGSMHSGSGKNIVSEQAVLSGTCRYFDADLIGTLEDAITRIARNTAAAFRADAQVVITPGLPPTVNDNALAALAQKSATALWGAQSLCETPRSGGCEDFAYYSRIAPSMFANVGAWDFSKGEPYPGHNPRFDVDEAALPHATALYAQFALDYLND